MKKTMGRITKALLVAIMTLSVFLPTNVLAEDDISLATLDTTAPVLESVSFEKTEATVGTDETVNLVVKAYDLESDITSLSFQVSYVDNDITGRRFAYEYYSDEGVKEGSNTTFTIPVKVLHGGFDVASINGLSLDNSAGLNAFYDEMI